MKDKLLLSIKETSDLFGIGQHRLRDIIREDYDCKYHLMVGRVIKIKQSRADIKYRQGALNVILLFSIHSRHFLMEG